MMSMSGAAVRREPGDEDIRLKSADDPYHITQYLVFVPDLQGLLRRFGKAEIEGTGKELFGAVDPARGQHFLGTYQPKLDAFFIADQVLAAIAPGHGQITGPV